jgi:hypothetical protein
MAKAKVISAPKRRDIELRQQANERRRRPRWSSMVPLCLTTSKGEIIPGLIVNLSTSGLLALVNPRFSTALLFPCGLRFTARFFVEESEICVKLDVVRVERHGPQLIALGCRFVRIPQQIYDATSARVAALLPRRSPRFKKTSSPTNRQFRHPIV